MGISISVIRTNSRKDQAFSLQIKNPNIIPGLFYASPWGSFVYHCKF
jgi:hypothetical protein